MVISRVIIRVTPFRALITLLITYLLSPLPLQVKKDALTREVGIWASTLATAEQKAFFTGGGGFGVPKISLEGFL